MGPTSGTGALFLDRDGVINRQRHDYVKRWEEFEFLPGALEALAELARLERPIVIVTNQSAIGRGIVPAATIESIHRRMIDVIHAAGGRIDGVMLCPHAPSARCDCRKPAPGMLLRAAKRYDVELENSLFVGDAVSDLGAARAAGCGAILVRSGRQGARLDAMLSEPVTIMRDLGEVAARLTLDTWRHARERDAQGKLSQIG